jgi:hypothetical protein
MSDYPYTNVPSNLKKLLLTIQTAGVPQKLSYKTLESFGFKSTNDRANIKILKFINFVSEDGVPSENWKTFRNKQTGPSVLGKAIQSGYSDLFSTYPDAHSRDSATIRNFFSAHTNVGERALSSMVTTFKTLCELGEFNQSEGKHDEVGAISNKQIEDASEPVKNIPLLIPSKGQGLSLNINIELHLPATQDGEIYDKLFESLKKHLL